MPRSPFPRPPRFLRWSLALLLATGLGLWLARDLPRRALAAALADRLAARVDLERLEIVEADRFRLLGLSIEGIRDYPAVETLRFEEVVAEGPLSGILAGRFERLTLRGGAARLVPAPRIEVPDRPLPMIGELILEPASVRVAAGREDLLLCLEAVIWGFGAEASGEARLDAAALELAPVHLLLDPEAPSPASGTLGGFAGSLSFDGTGSRLEMRATHATLAGGGSGDLEFLEPRWSIDASGELTEHRLAGARALLPLGGRPIEVEGPAAEGTLVLGEGGLLELDLAARLGDLGTGRVRADFDPAARRFRLFEARLRELAVGRLWPDSGLEATAAAVLSGTGERLDYTVTVLPTRLAPAAGAPAAGDPAADRELRPAPGTTLRVAGVTSFEPLADLQAPNWDGPVTASLSLPGARGRWGGRRLPEALFPLAASFDGRSSAGGGRVDPAAGGGRVDPAAGGGRVDPVGGATPRLTGSWRLDGGAGRLKAEGDVGFRDGQASADLTWTWDGLDLEHVASLLRAASVSLPAVSLDGDAFASGRLRGPIGTGTGPGVDGRLELRRLAGEDAAGAWSLSRGRATAAWSWDGARLELSEIEAAGTVAAAGLEPLALSLSASGYATGGLSRGRLAGTLRESPGPVCSICPPSGEPREPGAEPLLGTAYITADWRRHAAGWTASGHVHLDALDLDRWQRIVEPRVRAPALADYRLQGSASAELAGTFDAGTWRLAGPARLESAGFVSADGSRVLEGLESPWLLRLGGGRSAPIEVEGRGRLGGFLLLWNTFFGDFSDVSASLTARARLEPAGEGSPREASSRDGQRRWRLEAGMNLPEGPAAYGTLEGGSGTPRYTLSLDDPDLGATHRRYLAGLLEEQLGRLEVGGALAATVRGSAGPAAFSVIGDLRLRGLLLESGGGQAAVSGLDLDLPLDLRRRPGGRRSGEILDFSGPRLSGRLAFDRLAVRGLELPPTDTDLSVEADSLGLEKAITLDVLGGALTLERLTLNQLLRPGRHLESSIELADLSLERISEELELIPLAGALDGKLGGVRLSPSRLSVDGGGEIRAFGGTVTVRDISGQDVLSRFPKLKLSADFSSVDLGALTRRLDFGEMTGILEGTIEDLELFRGVPVRFSAHLETVHRKGVPRTVDVKAVNNLTILGTGRRATVFDRGVQRFFDRYTYERLAVDLRLERDVLLLRGLEDRGGRELFLRGRLPLRIDVVNAQPGKTVSFQAMVGRLKSLDFGQATTER